MNKYKIVSINLPTTETTEPVFSINNKKEYASVTTRVIKKALWIRMWTFVNSKYANTIEEEQKINICQALCKHFDGQAFVIFKQNESQILAEALSST